MIVRKGECGFQFTANNPVALGQALLALRSATASELQAAADGGRRALRDRFSPAQQSQRYARLAGVGA
jgi:glycosyltransferase involved in cell wall biosynthesis